MINESNNSLPNKVDELTNLKNNETSEPKAQEFSSLGLSQEPKSGKVNNNAKGDVPKVKPATVKVAETPDTPEVISTASSDPLANLGGFVKGQVNAGQPKLMKIDLNEYAPYFGNNVSWVTDQESLDKQRAKEQSAVEQFTYASGRVALNVVPEIIAQLANMADLEDYANSDQEVGNWLSNLMKQSQDAVNEALPIYRVNPDTPLDYGDSAWWFENGANLVTSAAGFVGAGYVSGGLLSTSFTKLGQGAKALRTMGKANQLGHKGQQTVYSLSALTNAIALNQAEGVGIGVDTYNQVYQQEMQKIKMDKKSIELTEEEIDKEARQRASIAASSAVNFNRINIMFNLTSAAMFLKTPLTTRNLISAPSIANTFKTIGLEGSQESAEELVNMFSQNQAVAGSNQEQYGFKEALSDAMSKEGQESALLGFIGGAGQTALTKAGKYIPMYKNSAYRQAYTEAYNKSDSSLSNEERDALANKEALAKVGNNKGLVSANFLQNSRYIEQQDALAKYSTMSATDKVGDITNAFYSAQENSRLLSEIKQAEIEGDAVKLTQLQDKLFTLQAYNAFELGTTEALLDLYKGYQNLSTEEAEAKGLEVEGDNNYKAKANKAIQTIEDLEKLYVESKQYLNSSDVYFMEEQKYMTSNKIQENLNKMNSIIEKAKKVYAGHNKKDITNSTYLDSSQPSGININNFTPAFKTTPMYHKLRGLWNADKIMREELEQTQEVLDYVTTSKFQNELSLRISNNRRNKKKEQQRKLLEKGKNVSKSAINNTINKLRQAVNNVETDTTIPDVDTNVETGRDTTTSPVVNDEVVDEVTDVVTDEVETGTTITDDVDTNVERFYPKTPITVAFPEFRNPNASAWINQVKNTIENSGIDIDSNIQFLEGVVKNFRDNRDAAEITTPFDLQAIDDSVVIIEDAISRLKEDKAMQVVSNETLREEQESFIDELFEETQEQEQDNTEETQSPSNKIDFKANLIKAQKLATILEKMQDNGVDITDFKAVVTSFELASSKNKVIAVFPMLKALYNVANNSQVEGTYEEIMYSQSQKQDVISKYEDILHYSKTSDTYTSDMDNISKEIINTYNELAKLNKLDASQSALGSETYNETASNKLAYLAKTYNLNFEPKVSSTGKPYIEVTKQDVNNLVNSMLDQRVLNPDFIKVGDTITFVPLASVTLEDGTIRTASESTEENSPIGIQINGELIEGLYLHDVSWLNNMNLDNTKEGIIEDQNKLRALRGLILNSKVPVSTTIINKTPGIPILDSSGEVNTVLTAMPEVEIGISRGGKIYTNEDTVVEVANTVEISEGKGVVVIPFGKKKLALPVRRARLNNQQVDSIVNAVRLYLDNKITPTTQQLNNEYGVNILSIKGLESYINNFIPLGKIRANTFEDFKSRLVAVADNVPVLQFANGQILYGYGQDIDTNYISKEKNDNEEREKDLLHLRKHLETLYNHVNLYNLKENNAIPFIADNGEVFAPYKDYKEYAKDSMITPYLAIKLEDGTTVYTIQSKIHFDIDSIFKNVVEVSNTTNTLPTTENVVKDNSSQRVILPNGKSFSFDDVTVDDFSPNIEVINEDDNELLATSSLIKGISIATQTSLYKSIANDIYAELLENSTEEDYQVTLRAQVNLAIQGLEMIQDLAEQRRIVSETFAKQADIINEQVSIIKANIGKVYQGVKLELNKKINLKTLEKFNTGQDTTFDEDEVNERSTYLDTLQFAIDPRTTLSKEVKQFLEGVVDKKVVSRIVDGQEVIEYRNVTNLLGLNKYISFDVVFNDLLKILSKSNNNHRLVSPADAVNDAYNSDKAYINNFISLIEQEVAIKPYLLDVVDKLKNAELHTQNAFVTALNKTHTNHIFLQSTYNTDTKKYSIRAKRAASRNLTGLILSEWRNNLNQSKIVDTIDNKLVLNSEALTEFNTLFTNIKTGQATMSYNSVAELLSIIGIELEPKVYALLATKGLKVGENRLTLSQMFTLSNGIFRNIHERVNNFDTQFNNALSLEEEAIFEDNAFKVLAQLTSNFRTDLFTDSFKNGNGDTIYGYSNSRFVTDRFAELKSNVNLLLELKKDPFIKDSLWLNDLLIEDEAGARINTNSVFYKNFEYSTSDSLKVKNNVIGKTIDSLKPHELEKYHLGLYFNGGTTVGKTGQKTPVIRVVYPTMSDKANTFVFQVLGKHYKFGSNNKLSEKDKLDLVKTLMYPEVQRIRAFENRVEKTGISAYDKGAGKFLMFPLLNEMTDLWEEDGTLKAGVGVEAKYDEILKTVLSGYLNAELKNKLETWRRYNIISTDKNTKIDRIQYIDANFNNQFGTENYYETALNYVINTMVANMNIQQLFIGDPANYYKPAISDKSDIERAVSTFDNQGKRLAGDNAGKTQYVADPTSTFNYLVIADNKVTASNYEYIKNTFGEEMANDYTGINSSDAQEYTTLEEHLTLMLGEGKISQADKDRILDVYIKTGKVKNGDKKVILNPTKPVYVNNINRGGVNARLYVKSSSIPLLKEFTAGTPLDTLREFMETENIQRVAYESAVKVGLPSTVINIFNEDGDVVIPANWKSSVISNVPRYGHGNQQEVPYSEEKKEVNDGTQQAKLLFTNLLTVDGFINPFTGEKVKGRQLADEYFNRYELLFKGKYQQLVEDLQFNPTTGEIKNLAKLKKILVDEGLSRNYSTNDIAGFELNDILTEFQVPLWLNNADSKIVALLNSIVDNRVRKRKFRGKSFVLAAPSGVKFKTIEDINKSSIVKVGDWDGTLKGAVDKEGKMTYAEVLLPFKFWDNNGKLLKVEDFLNDDGTLDLKRIPEEALEIFGYRIPTSGVNLISTIKVVGFLPSSMGDVVIAPEEFIVQMGSDFDVDKLYTHMYNTYYNSDSKSFEIITNKTIASIANIKKNITVLNNSLKLIKQNESLSQEEKDRKLEETQNRLNRLKSSELLILDNVEEAVLQNELLDIHKAVLNNPAKEVQYARNRPLSFGQLPSLAKTVFNQGDNRYFSPLRNSYQTFKYLSARAGKTAVGIFSLDMVFNSALQFVETPLNFVYRREENGKEIVTPISYNIAGQRTVALNQEKTTKGRFKSEVIEAFMTAALDNEKEQLLGKLNINNNTFDFIRAATLLGFEEDVIIGVINQPLVKEYLNSLTIIPNKLDEEYRQLLSSISVDELIKLTQTTNTNTKIQEALLAVFVTISNHGSELKAIQSTINSDSAGIGKNMFYNIEKANQILNLPRYDSSIPGVSKVIGDYQILSNPDTYKEDKQRLLDEGYYQYKGIFIKPLSLGGFAGVYATLFNNELWRNLYPYTKPSMSYMLEYSLLGKSDIESNTITKLADNRQDAVTAYKSLLSSGMVSVFSNYSSVAEARKDLLFDNENHMSLGTIVHTLKQNKIYNNALLDRLQIGRGNLNIDTTGKIPTDISYYNALTLEMDEEIVINSIIEMIVNKTPLGEFNGELLTSKDLADKLITHQIITGGVQKSGQFIKYIPFKYLQQKGYYNKLEALANLTLQDDGLKQISNMLRTQNIQHNPAEYYDEVIEEQAKFTGNYATLPDDFIRLSKGFIIKKENGDRYSIFKYDASISQFVKIDNLGYKGIQEYDISQTFAGKSTVYINQVGVDSNTSRNVSSEGGQVEELPDGNDVANFLRVDRDVTEDNSPLTFNTFVLDYSKRYHLMDNSLSVEDKYRLILKEIKDNTTSPIIKYFSNKLTEVVPYLSTVPLYVDFKLKAKGVTKSLPIVGEPVQIRVNSNLINSEQELQEVLIEEMVHALLKSELSQDTIASRSIKNIYNDVKAVAIAKYGKEAYDTMVSKVQKKMPLRDGVERNILYNLYNIDEFVAAAIKDKTFQEFLNNTDATNTTKSLWTRFIEAIKKVLETLGVRKDSNLEAVLHETLNLFDNVNNNLYKELTVPQYVRTIEYLNKRFNLVDEANLPLTKGNSTEIANFINKNIINVNAKVVDNKVLLSSNTVADFEANYSPDIEFENSNVKGNFTNYNTALDIRINKLVDSIKKAKQDKNFTRVAELSDLLLKEKQTKADLQEIESLVVLSDKANQDLELVDTMLNRPMTSEDIVYARSVVNFWKSAKEMLFNERAYSSDPLRRLYGSIEGSAELRSDKLFLVEKRHMEDFIKTYTGKEVDLDKQFSEFKDINFFQAKVRDISTYDNKMLDSIWLSIKQANIAAVDEGTKLLEGFDKQLEAILPVLKSLNTAEPFDIFRQKTDDGKYTNHLVNPFNYLFYKHKREALGRFYASNNKQGLTQFTKWLEDNAINTKLSLIFPTDGKETPEGKQAKLELQAQLGIGTYNYWYKQQSKKIERYNNERQGYIDFLLKKYDVNTIDELVLIPDANTSYNFWIERNSPYNLEAMTFNNKKVIDVRDFNNVRYYEVVPSNKTYIDEDYKVIENNIALLDFYQSVDNILDELKQYVPERQQRALAYGGIPAIEKSLYEMFSTDMSKLAFKPIYDTFIKSMQTSFSDVSVANIDPVTGKPINEMRIPLIKDSYKAIKEYVDFKVSEFVLANKREPNNEELKEFELEAVDNLARNNSFDLGKIVKVYSALVLAHKHKAKLEDGINIGQNILNSYQEVLTRPDGSAVINAETGVVQRKAKSESFLQTKAAVDAYIKNVMYGDVKEEEGKGKTILTKSEKLRKQEIIDMLSELENQRDTNQIDDALYSATKASLEKQLADLGKTFIYSKAGDNILKYVQLKLMGWNFLGGISNMGFGYISNQIEGAGGQLYTTKDLNYAYKLVANSMLKNATFNQVETETAKKIRSAMDKWDVLKDASHELYTASIPNSFTNKLKALKPYNMNQRTEYINQAPLLIALTRNVEVDTPKGKVSLWEGYDENFNWKPEYGEEPKDIVNKTRIRLDQLIKRNHGNYDNLSPLAAKRTFMGRAVSQFRTWLYESVAVRVEKERYDSALDIYVKGRYRSVGTVYSNTNIGALAKDSLLALLKTYTFGLIDNTKSFDNLVDGENIKEVDAANMRKVIKEVSLALNTYLFLLLLSSLKGDDDDNKVANVLFNQGTRLKTDLLLYVNPMEARNIVRDLIPSFMLLKDISDWFESVGYFIAGEDEVKTGVHAGDSRLGASSVKMLPFGAKLYGIYNSTSQTFEK